MCACMESRDNDAPFDRAYTCLFFPSRSTPDTRNSPLPHLAHSPKPTQKQKFFSRPFGLSLPLAAPTTSPPAYMRCQVVHRVGHVSYARATQYVLRADTPDTTRPPMVAIHHQAYPHPTAKRDRTSISLPLPSKQNLRKK